SELGGEHGPRIAGLRPRRESTRQLRAGELAPPHPGGPGNARAEPGQPSPERRRGTARGGERDGEDGVVGPAPRLRLGPGRWARHGRADAATARGKGVLHHQARWKRQWTGLRASRRGDARRRGADRQPPREGNDRDRRARCALRVPWESCAISSWWSTTTPRW